jgi:pyrimidine deaminase RibD-like protein
MWKAIDISMQARADPGAFCVGAVIVDIEQNELLSTGFSRELGGRSHAEECALSKLKDHAESMTIYTTMEPCSKRLSGNLSCADRIVGHNRNSDTEIVRVVVGVKEPKDFVSDCHGCETLQKEHIEVLFMPKEMSQRLLRLARGK